MFNGKSLFITGGTGSFGNAVLRRFLDTDIKEIRVFSRDEKKQEDMRIEPATTRRSSSTSAMCATTTASCTAMDGVDYVFHAAALKQVPSCEFYPLEAVRTNILGAENVLNAAMATGVKRVIVLSTDKAVYPINAMGISKAMMEKLDGRQGAHRRPVEHHPLRHPLRQRHGLARLGHPAVHQADQGRQAADRHRPEHDPVHDVARRCGGSGALCLRARPAGRHLRAEGAGVDHRDLALALKELFEADNADPGHRHPPRREALRDPADPRGDGAGRGPGRLLPGPGRRPRPELRHATSPKGEEQLSGLEDYNSHNTRRWTSTR